MEVARDFIKNYLPESILKIIDLETLELQKDSFINEELQEVFQICFFKLQLTNRKAMFTFSLNIKVIPAKVWPFSC